MNVNESEAMRRLPRTCRAADWVLWFDEVDSTNTVARRLLSEAWQPVDAAGPDVAGTATVTACAGAAGVFGDGIADAVAEPPIAVIVADSQTAGHGRLGRQWVSRPGESSMVSFATVLPQSLVTDSRVNGWLQMIAGLAAVEAIDDVCAQVGATCTHASPDMPGASPDAPDCSQDGSADVAGTHSAAGGQGVCSLRLKWPNDVFLHDHKLGGILLELVLPHGGAASAVSDAAAGTGTRPCPSVPDDRRMVGLVIGIGLNLAIPADRLPTELSTSLQLHRAPLPDPMRLRDLIAGRMTAALRDRLRAFMVDPTGYAAALRDEMEPLCWTLGRPVEARLVDGGAVRGTALRLNPDASLAIRDVAGDDHTVTTGDVGVL
ncbi:biotin--[acetyl-CoA-carboxylase] ligase [Bifidobacterium pullorum]|uniref:biotin--[acetyl-CoA-carboxylase] ligase n=1 Tax=Bifidobacterium pullorum TaxID=78448 RepID=UPI003994755B